MQIFLDSINLDSIALYRSFIVGITTNPTILAQNFASKDAFLNILEKIQTQFPELLIHIQVTAQSCNEIYEEAKRIAVLGRNIIIKIPLTFEGLQAINKLQNLDMLINGTLCFSLLQAQMAQDMGVTYISPFLGRMQEAQIDIAEFCYNLRELAKDSQLLGSSIRNLEHIELVIAQQFDAITFNEKFFKQAFEIELLKNGQKIFESCSNIKF